MRPRQPRRGRRPPPAAACCRDAAPGEPGTHSHLLEAFAEDSLRSWAPLAAARLCGREGLNAADALAALAAAGTELLAIVHQYRNEREPLKVSLPGGKRWLAEDAHASALREAAEETGGDAALFAALDLIGVAPRHACAIVVKALVVGESGGGGGRDGSEGGAIVPAAVPAPTGGGAEPPQSHALGPHAGPPPAACSAPPPAACGAPPPTVASVGGHPVAGPGEAAPLGAALASLQSLSL